MKDYQKHFTIDKPVSEVYAAITLHISDWWSNDLTGAAVHAADEFNIAFGKTRKTFRIEEAVPGQKVVWKCVRAFVSMDTLKNKSEWEGTKIYWTLESIGQGTSLGFLHEGLNPDFECYEICESGWDHFLGSLEKYLKTGRGNPHQKAVLQ